MNASQQTQNPKVSLRTVQEPSTGSPLVHAPPTLIASTHTIDYACEICDTILLHAEAGQVHNLVIHCNHCGSYNLTEG